MNNLIGELYIDFLLRQTLLTKRSGDYVFSTFYGPISKRRCQFVYHPDDFLWPFLMDYGVFNVTSS